MQHTYRRWLLPVLLAGSTGLALYGCAQVEQISSDILAAQGAGGTAGDQDASEEASVGGGGGDGTGGTSETGGSGGGTAGSGGGTAGSGGGTAGAGGSGGKAGAGGSGGKAGAGGSGGGTGGSGGTAGGGTGGSGTGGTTTGPDSGPPAGVCTPTQPKVTIGSSSKNLVAGMSGTDALKAGDTACIQICSTSAVTSFHWQCNGITGAISINGSDATCGAATTTVPAAASDGCWYYSIPITSATLYGSISTWP